MEKEFNKETEGNEANKCLLKREETGDRCGESTGCRGRGRERETERAREKESHTCFASRLIHLYGGSPSRLLLANHLASSGFVLTKGPVYMSIYHKGPSEVDRMYYVLVPLLSLSPEEPFCRCVVPEISLVVQGAKDLGLLLAQELLYASGVAKKFKK